MELLLSRLVRKGVRIGATEEALRIQTGHAKLTDADKQELKNAKPELIRLLKNRKAACLSYPQERLWFLAQLGYSRQYHIPSAIRITGNLDTDALKKIMKIIVQRHESFRTSFRQLGDLPVQFIEDHHDLFIEEVDLSNYAQADQESELFRVLKEFTDRPFDLEEAPLVRVMLVKLAENDYAFAICMHHIISDGWSSGIIMNELNEGYSALEKGQTPDFAPIKMQYSGYAVWQKETYNSEKIERDLTYWKEKLDGYQDLDLPTDFIRPAKTTGKGGSATVLMEADLRDRLKMLSKEKRTTVFTILVATTYLVLSKYGRQNDICFGMPVANRNHKDIEEIVGFFVNTLIIRVAESESEAFTGTSLLEYVNKAILEGQENQDVPVEKIIEYLKPARDLSRSPIFQVLINYGKLDGKAVTFGDCQLESLPTGNAVSKFDLTFGFSEYPTGEIGVGLEYSTDLFTEETIRQLLKNFMSSLSFLTEHVEKPLSEFVFTTEEEKDKILNEYNNTDKKFEEKCIHELIDKTASDHPEAVAITTDKGQMSYRELSQKSTSIAAWLQNNHQTNGKAIGICMQRSEMMIVSLLAVLKSGAAYLPLDPSYPAERLQFMIADAGVSVILTDETSAAALKPLTGESVELVDLKSVVYENETSDLINEGQSVAEDLAYIIYTSGSTGNPKGVKVSHGNVANHNQAAIALYGISAGDQVMQFSTINFDIFVEEVFPTLIAGATLVMLDQEKYLNIDYLKNTIAERKVTVVNWPTAFWHSMSDEDFKGTDLRMVIIGGEKAEMSYFKMWNNLNPGVRVMNTYGPTETTVISLAYEIKEIEKRNIPIGRPIANTKAYIMNSNNQLLGTGIPGELCIAGKGVSMGYLNNEALTAEKFVAVPQLNSTVVYKTGDLVRWLPDGNIEFLGRIDEQVKIRGFRVEPGEVENALVSHPEVSKAVVIARNLNIGKQLIAYYTSDAEIENAELKKYMSSQVPEYMVPLLFNRLDTIPMTPGGKINKRALRDIEIDLSSNTGFVAPETAVQQALADLWKEVLQVESVGIHHNFFELGGNSIMATQLLSKINNSFNTEINLTTLFENPTVDLLSQVLPEIEQVSGEDESNMEIETLEF